MRFSLESYGDHCIVSFIDPTTPRWVCFHRATQRSSIPHGNNCYYKLCLGSDGTVELAIKEDHGATLEQELYLIVRGAWELHGLWEDGFAIAFFLPTFEIIQHGYGVDFYRTRFREGWPWMFHNTPTPSG